MRPSVIDPESRGNIATTFRLTEPLPLITFYPAIVASAWFDGFEPGLTTTLLSAVIAEHFWGSPVGLGWAVRLSAPRPPPSSEECPRRIPYGGAPRIHGELLKLGIDLAERTVSRLLSKLRPSQTRRSSPTMSATCPSPKPRPADKPLIFRL